MEENAKNNKQTNEKVVKQETIMDTANTKETGMRNKKEKSCLLYTSDAADEL